MASKTDIINRALSKLGEPRIANADTANTKPARVMAGMWDNVKDAMLQSYPWKFAATRAALAADLTTPAYGWDYEYSLPSDYLAIIEIKDNPDYTIENGKILINEAGPLYIRYIRRITNTGQFHALFNEALASRLAYEGADEITDSNTKKEAALRDLNLAVTQAYQIDAIEVPPEELPEDDWITARL